MANSLSNLTPKILANSVVSLRENAVVPSLVNQGYSLQPSQKGSTITVPVPTAQTASAVTNSNSFPSNTDTTDSAVTVSLDKWYYTKFHLNDQELTQIDGEGAFIPMQASEAIKSLVNQAESDLLAEYKSVYSTTGTAGTTPFASNATAWLTGARKLLNEELAPMGNRRVILDPAAEGNAMGLEAFQSAAWRGDGAPIREGEIGRVLGADFYMNQNIPTHTNGTLTNSSGMLAKVNDASYTVGESTVDIDDTSLSGTVVVGDVFTVAGDTQTYTVTANATAATNAIAGMAFTPASKVAWADDAVVTFKTNASSVQNLAFHRDAFAFASAPLADAAIDTGELGQPQSIIRDPISGLVIRLTAARQFMQTTFYFDMLYGVKLVRPELAARILG